MTPPRRDLIAEYDAQLAALRVLRIAQLGYTPRSRFARWIRGVLVAPLVLLFEALGIHGIVSLEHNGVHCRCGRFLRIEDLRPLGLPTRSTGCRIATIYNWVYWRPISHKAERRGGAAASDRPSKPSPEDPTK